MSKHYETRCKRVAHSTSLPVPRPLSGRPKEKPRNLLEKGLGTTSRSSLIRSVVVPLDGSLHAEHALPHALAIARRAGAVLRITQAYCRFETTSPGQTFSFEMNIKENERERLEYLSNVAERIACFSNVRIETALMESNETNDAWVKSTSGADLVVIASRRGGLLPRLWPSTTAEVLRRHSESPLLLVPGYSFPVDLTGDPFPRRILVPLDGSIDSEKILRPATAVASLDNSLVTLLNVQNERWNRGSFENTTPLDYLKSVIRNSKGVTHLVEAHILTTDRKVARGIADYAARRGTNLIALATESDGRFTRFMRGSVVDFLVARSNVPILIQGFNPRSKRPEITNVS